MISNTDFNSEELTKFVEEEYSFLLDQGFSETKVSRQDGMITIDWFAGNIALEMELDLRERQIFVLLVRLENGKMPSGYYVSNGVPCRLHLQNLLKKQNWPIDKLTFKSILPGANKGKRHHLNSMEDIQQNILTYKKLISLYLPKLLEENTNLFN